MNECTCGKSYGTETGVKFCQANRHGLGFDDWNQKEKLKHTIEKEIVVCCSGCTTPLRSYLRIVGGQVEINILPHVCALPEE